MAPAAIRVVLLDIEGTVCPISFVKDILFPYAVKALPETLGTKWHDAGFRKYRDAFPAQHSVSPAALEAHFNDLVVRDVKVAYLKDLQGYLWESGYVSGEIKAPLFPDVAAKLSSWHRDNGIQIMIYSSGSVSAQKLLFQHTDAGDLTSLISDWFDTANAGIKTKTRSYTTIASRHPESPPAQWLFLSDNVGEVEAAIAAGMQSRLVQRPGNAPLPADVVERLQVVHSFEDLSLDDESWTR